MTPGDLFVWVFEGTTEPVARTHRISSSLVWRNVLVGGILLLLACSTDGLVLTWLAPDNRVYTTHVRDGLQWPAYGPQKAIEPRVLQ